MHTGSNRLAAETNEKNVSGVCFSFAFAIYQKVLDLNSNIEDNFTYVMNINVFASIKCWLSD